jgi:hypothetical protein
MDEEEKKAKKAAEDKEKKKKKFDYSSVKTQSFLYNSNKLLWKKWVRAKMRLFFIVR